LRDQSLGADYPDTLYTLHSLAVAYGDGGLPARAAPLFKRIADRVERERGSHDPETLTFRDHEARSLRRMNDLAQALPLQQAVFERRRAVLGPDHADTLKSMDGLAVCCRKAGRLDESLRLSEDCLKRRRTTLGPTHPDTAGGLNNHGVTLSTLGRHDEAIVAYEEALRIHQSLLEPGAPSILNTKYNLAVALDKARRPDRARLLYRELVDSIRRGRFQNPGSVQYFRDAIRFAELHREFSEAEQWQRALLAVIRERHGPRSAETASELIRLGTKLLGLQRWPDAEAELRASLAITREIAPGTLAEFAAEAYLATALVRQGRDTEAEALFAKAYRGLTSTPGVDPAPMAHELPSVLEELITLDGKLNRPAEVERWKAERVRRLAASKPSVPTKPVTAPAEVAKSVSRTAPVGHQPAPVAGQPAADGRAVGPSGSGESTVIPAKSTGGSNANQLDSRLNSTPPDSKPGVKADS